MYAKLCLYEGSINGWGRCNCLKQGISLSLMSRGCVMGLFTFLWWQGAGVIRNTNPLINFQNRGSFWSEGCIAGSAAWNNARVICSLTEFATLIWLYYEVESLKVLLHFVTKMCLDWLKEWINNVLIRGNNSLGLRHCEWLRHLSYKHSLDKYSNPIKGPRVLFLLS